MKITNVEIFLDMEFVEIAAQIMCEQTFDFLVARELTIKTGRELGIPEDKIAEGIDEFLEAAGAVFKETTQDNIRPSFSKVYLDKEKAPTEVTASDVDAHSNNQLKSNMEGESCQ